MTGFGSPARCFGFPVMRMQQFVAAFLRKRAIVSEHMRSLQFAPIQD